MAIKLSKEAYSKQIQADIDNLNMYMPRHSLEKDHIIMVLRESISLHYDKPTHKRSNVETVNEPPVYKSRCCGRCIPGVDECVLDMICEDHKEQGCEICYGKK